MAASEKSGRPQGRPKKGESPIKEEDYDDIVKLYYTGYGLQTIAEKYGVTRAAMHAIWNNKILVRQRVNIPELTVERFYWELESIKSSAWEKFHSDAPAETREQVTEQIDGDKKVVNRVIGRTFRPGQVAWMDVIMKATDMELKMAGLYQVTVKQEVDLRYAGSNEKEVAADIAGEIQHHLRLIGVA